MAPFSFLSLGVPFVEAVGIDLKWRPAGDGRLQRAFEFAGLIEDVLSRAMDHVGSEKRSEAG